VRLGHGVEHGLRIRRGGEKVIHDLGMYRTGAVAVHPDAVGGKVHRQHLAQLHHGTLARPIRLALRVSGQGTGRTRVDDRSLVTAAQMGQSVLGTKPDPGDVDAHHFFKSSAAHTIQGKFGGNHAFVNAGVIVQDVDAAESFGSRRHERLDLGLVRHVAVLVDGFTASRADLLHQCLARVVVQVRNHHPGTATGRQAGGAGPDAHGATGNDKAQTCNPHRIILQTCCLRIVGVI
jgi:hypothetical protein